MAKRNVEPETVRTVFRVLKRTQGHHPTMLEQLREKGYTPFQLLVSTVLSSRTKDETTLPIVKRLFKIYKTPQQFAHANVKRLEKILYGIGFYRVKSRTLKKLGRDIIEKHRGKIPKTRQELQALPGVGRKTASCVLSYALDIPCIAADVHVHVVGNRLGWCKTKTPEQTELALEKVIPKPLWISVNERLVVHGQLVCQTLRPKCWECPITKWCRYYKTVYVPKQKHKK